MTRRVQLWVKRFIDVVLSIMLLVLLSPLLAGVAVLVRFTSPGPAIFTQRRVGLTGRHFTVFKFRTMVVGAETAGAGYFMEKNDPRITRVGRFLRQFSIDEIPELVNVLRGDMSLVGPRPTLPYHVEMYDAVQWQRLLMRPGITGLAQVNGRNEIPWSKRIELDVRYVQDWSLMLDLSIMLKTIWVVLGHVGVRQDQGREQVEDITRPRASSM